MGPMIPKEMKYNLHYGEVRGDVLQIIINYKLDYSARGPLLKCFTVFDVCLHSLEYTEIC